MRLDTTSAKRGRLIVPVVTLSVVVIVLVFWIGWTAGRTKVPQPTAEKDDQWVDFPTSSVQLSPVNLSHLSVEACQRLGRHGTLLKCTVKHDGRTSEIYEGWGFEVTPMKWDGEHYVHMSGVVSAPDIGLGRTAEIQMRVPPETEIVWLSHN